MYTKYDYKDYNMIFLPMKKSNSCVFSWWSNRSFPLGIPTGADDGERRWDGTHPHILHGSFPIVTLAKVGANLGFKHGKLHICARV